jgi:hypothetical protein
MVNFHDFGGDFLSMHDDAARHPFDIYGGAGGRRLHGREKEKTQKSEGKRAQRDAPIRTKKIPVDHGKVPVCC